MPALILGFVLGGGAFIGGIIGYAIWLYFQEKKEHKGSNIKGPLL